MKIEEFKIWFDGLICGVATGATLSSAQLEALKKKIASLDVMAPAPAQSPVPPFVDDSPKKEPVSELDIFRKIIEDQKEKQSPKVDPLDPFGRLPKWTPPFGPMTWHDAYKGGHLGSDYPPDYRYLCNVVQNEGESLSDFLGRASLKLSDWLIDQASLDENKKDQGQSNAASGMH